MSVLEKLNIFGFSRFQEDAIFASLYLGEPLLFIGPKGVAKTEIVAAIGAALRESSKRKYPEDPTKWFSYQIYDASKLNFEDLVGYPNPNDMRKDPPSVSYIPTKSTIWNKHLIAFDELNRCQEDRQSNLFEIIRSRKLHGIPTNNYFIFSTMNPYGDSGTIEMSDALVDRHLFYLKVDNFSSMQFSDREKVIARVGNYDALGLRYWSDFSSTLDVDEDHSLNASSINNNLADVGDLISSIMEEINTQYTQIRDDKSSDFNYLINTIITTLSISFKDNKKADPREIEISGRRASAMFRGILAMKAVDLVLSRKFNLNYISSKEVILSTIRFAMPIGIASNSNSELNTQLNDIINQLVDTVWSSIENKEKLDKDLYLYSLKSSSFIQILYNYLSDPDNVTNIAVLNEFLSQRPNSKCSSKIIIEALRTYIPDYFQNISKYSEIDTELLEKPQYSSQLILYNYFKEFEIYINNIFSSTIKSTADNINSYILATALSSDYSDYNLPGSPLSREDTFKYILLLTNLFSLIRDIFKKAGK